MNNIRHFMIGGGATFIKAASIFKRRSTYLPNELFAYISDAKLYTYLFLNRRYLFIYLLLETVFLLAEFNKNLG